MKRISVRDLRQKWPEAERALNIESELVITRDGEPVARLTRYENRSKKDDVSILQNMVGGRTAWQQVKS